MKNGWSNCRSKLLVLSKIDKIVNLTESTSGEMTTSWLSKQKQVPMNEIKKVLNREHKNKEQYERHNLFTTGRQISNLN